jgi:hypothetical protein
MCISARRPAVLGFFFLVASSSAPQAQNNLMINPNLIKGCQAAVGINKDNVNNDLALLQGTCIGVVVTTVIYNKNKLICLPSKERTSTRDALLVVSEYIRKTPNSENQDLVALVQKALIQAWPCKG